MRNFVIAAGLMFASAGAVWASEAKEAPVLGGSKDNQMRILFLLGKQSI